MAMLAVGHDMIRINDNKKKTFSKNECNKFENRIVAPRCWYLLDRVKVLPLEFNGFKSFQSRYLTPV